ncbi:hypothetical protein H4R33_006605, partial [Dimargaris cristalligena]
VPPPPRPLTPKSTLAQDLPSELDLTDEFVLNGVLPRAIDDTHSFIPMGLDHLEAIKKDQVLLTTRIRGLETRLELEVKMRDAARSLAQLHANSKKMAKQAKEQLDNTNRKVTQVLEELRALNQRHFQNQILLIQHSAAILRQSCINGQRRARAPRISTVSSRDQLSIASTSRERLGRSSSIKSNSSSNTNRGAAPEADMAPFMERLREMERRLLSLHEDQQRSQDALDAAHVQLDQKDGLIIELREDLERARANEASAETPQAFRRSTTTFSTGSISNSNTALSPAIFRTPSACLESLEQDMHGVSLPAWTQEATETSIHLQAQIEELKTEKSVLLQRIVQLEGSTAPVSATGSTADLRLSEGAKPSSRFSQSSFMNDAVSITSHFGETSTIEDDTANLKSSLTTATKAQAAAESALKEEKFQIRKFKGSISQDLDVVEATLGLAFERYQWPRSPMPFDNGTQANTSLIDPATRLKTIHKQLEHCLGAFATKNQSLEQLSFQLHDLYQHLPRSGSANNDVNDDADGLSPPPDNQGIIGLIQQRCSQTIADLSTTRTQLQTLETQRNELAISVRDIQTQLEQEQQAHVLSRSTSVPDPPAAQVPDQYDQIDRLELRLGHQSLELAQLRETLDTTQTNLEDTQASLNQLTATHKSLQVRLRDKEDEVNHHKTQATHLQQSIVECQRTHFTPAMLEKERKRLFSEHESQLSRIRLAHTAQLHKTHGQYLAKDQQLNQRDDALRRELDQVISQFERITKRCQEFETERGRYEHKIDDLRHQVFALETALTQSRVDRIIGWSDSPSHLSTSTADAPGSKSPALSSSLLQQSMLSVRSASPFGRPSSTTTAATVTEDGMNESHMEARRNSADPSMIGALGVTTPTLESGRSSGTLLRPNLSQGLAIQASEHLDGEISSTMELSPLLPPTSLARLSGGGGGSPSTSHAGTPTSVSSGRSLSFSTPGGAPLHSLNAQKFAKLYPQLLTLRNEFRDLVANVRTQHRTQLDTLFDENRNLTLEVRTLKQKWADRLWSAVSKSCQTETVEETPIAVAMETPDVDNGESGVDTQTNPVSSEVSDKA